MSARSLQSLALLCAATAVGLICLFFTHHAGSDRELLEDDTSVRKIGRPAIRLSLAHQQLTKMAIFRKKAAMQALSDCGCVGGQDELSDNTWGHYTPECCNPSKDRDSLDSVLDSYIQNALDGTQNLSVALTQAKKKMDKKLSVIIDAVTLKNAGRPGPPGPDGPQGPTGYPGAPGPQGPRGPAGLLGAVGPKGAPGPEGYRGATGDIGPKGLQGYIGTPGSPGFTGPDGLRGIVGAMGPPGPKGPPGPPGNPGMMGRTGDNGPTGPKGRDGRVLNVNGYVEDTDACQSACGGGLDALSSQLITCRRRWGDAFVEAFHMGGNGNYGVNGCGGCSGKYYTTCISPAMNPTAAFTQCATENQVCTCTGNVRYGVPGSWTNVKSVTGSVVCGNSAFGDPIYGTAKTCQCASASDLGVTGCETVMSSCQVARGTTINFLDRQSVTCPDGKLISEMQMVGDGCPANQLRYRSVCCQPVRGLSNCRQVQTNCQYVNTYDVIYFDRQNVACDQFEAMSSWQFTKDGCPSDNMKYVYNCCKLSF